MANPTKAQIKLARSRAELTQKASAELVFNLLRSWQAWEGGRTKMPEAIWWFYLLRTGQITIDQVPDME